ncbi:Rieske (2Fe-2S) protein [Steroidobacter cummioxidans]|uniref:Rieske (2Fe-2S) protein n=1 Tax=Steroidobacter cummioxidans TaxID=1803913 RepID=UPI0019D447FD|nr:Rieske 2Fe-2S domain-containing protein [Steroidobacter cummioxidans]
MSWKSHPHAPEADTEVCPLAAVPDGGCIEVSFGVDVEALRLIVLRRGADAWAYVNVCPHFSLPLNSRPGEFLVTEDQHLMCAYHCALFRFHDGLCVDGPAKDRSLEAVPVTIVDGVVRIAT